MDQSRVILKISNLQKYFGSFAALKNVNIEIREGRITGFLGKNGAGKTTLIKTVLGLYKKFEGEIVYDGKKIDPENAIVMRTIGSLVDVRFHEDLSAYDNLKLLLMASDIKPTKGHKQKIYDVLELVGLQHNARSKVKSFSMGMKQRLGLAQALMTEAKLLILDEPFVGLDPLGIQLIRNKLQELCREKGMSIIFSSHQLTETAEISDDIIVIDKGEITYSGTYEKLVNETKKYHIYTNKTVLPFLRHQDKIEIEKEGQKLKIRKSDAVLQDILEDLLANNILIEDILIEDNSLLRLFQEE